MASRILLLPLRRPASLALSTTLGISSIFAAQSLLTLRQPPLRCDSAQAAVGDFVRGYARDAQVPIVGGDRRTKGEVIRQLSAGSVSGELLIREGFIGWTGFDGQGRSRRRRSNVGRLTD